jgi:hypothetical protein
MWKLYNRPCFFAVFEKLHEEKYVGLQSHLNTMKPDFTKCYLITLLQKKMQFQRFLLMEANYPMDRSTRNLVLIK